MKNANKFTPGPWNVLYSSNIYPSIHSGSTNIPVATLYAHTSNRSERDVFENSEANARLIAAAPELLEALVVAQQQVAALKRQIVWHDCASVNAVTASERTISAAITKATGGES